MKYYITYGIIEEWHGEIEADSLEEAIEKACDHNGIENADRGDGWFTRDWELYDDPSDDPIADCDEQGNIQRYDED